MLLTKKKTFADKVAEWSETVSHHDYLYHTFKIPKIDKKGNVRGHREISSPNTQLLQLQQELLRILTTNRALIRSRSAYGFVKGRSVVDMARVHKDNPYAFRIDLKDFFDNLGPLVRELRYAPALAFEAYRQDLEPVIGPDLCGFFTSPGKWTRREGHYFRERVTNGYESLEIPPGPRSVLHLLTKKEEDPPNPRYSLATGAATTPAISNMLMFQVDAVIGGVMRNGQSEVVRSQSPKGYYASATDRRALWEAEKIVGAEDAPLFDHDFRYTRYCDDIIVSGKSPAVFATYHILVRLLRQYGLKVNRKKTKFFKPGDRRDFCGVSVNQDNVLVKNRRYRRNLRAEVHNYMKDYARGRAPQGSFLMSDGSGIAEIPVLKVLGKIDHILHINPNDTATAELRKQFLEGLGTPKSEWSNKTKKAF